ncbi:DUF3304 domain-containing protein [Luteimonas sp. SJ-92]|uniref:DUF3304 domain-containing protein n=1 Tax=Luteimonas salinisoli TaxID=2752307 RepID=A0A853JJE3_9GAMM|nr:DUF3304 domain-containing protein [Luteimonas salinisoli]NZA28500.1 DUF3304 domain-containing protein [Luteimonas salinisoli]
MTKGVLLACERADSAKLPVSVILSLLPMLVACGADPDARFGTSVTAMDHDPSDTLVRSVTVDGAWAGPAGTGGSTVCCVSLPVRWHEGLQATVRWERCEPYGENCRWHEKAVPIHPYTEVGRVWLHIVNDDEVAIIPSMLAPDHPDYPGPGYPEKDFFRKKDTP